MTIKCQDHLFITTAATALLILLALTALFVIPASRTFITGDTVTIWSFCVAISNFVTHLL